MLRIQEECYLSRATCSQSCSFTEQYKLLAFYHEYYSLIGYAPRIYFAVASSE